MSNTIYANHNQRFLLPPAIENWVSPKHPARFIRKFVECINLKEIGFKERESEEGRPNYSNELLLSIWLYGHFEKIYSSRALEKCCHDHMGFIWITGMNQPDHNTIWRFFHNNRSLIKSIFKQSVKLAIKSELVGFALHAVDGTKVYADVSRKRSMHKKELEVLLSRLDESIEEIITDIDKVHQEEIDEPEYTLPIELRDEKKLEKVIREGFEELTEEEKRKVKRIVERKLAELKREGREHLSITDRECRLMKSKSGVEFCYNAQGVVDDKYYIIVGESVTNEEADRHQLMEMLEEVQESSGEIAAETVFDGGYFSGEGLAQAEEKGYSILVNLGMADGGVRLKGGIEFHKSRFRYERETDSYICPEGHKLGYEKSTRREDRKYESRVYRCGSYEGCCSRERCSKDKRGRTIDRTPYEESVVRQIEKQKIEEKKDLLKKRKQIVEPVFGWIKHNNHFNRWLYRGIENVEAQWSLVCASVNLKRLYSRWVLNGLVFS